MLSISSRSISHAFSFSVSPPISLPVVIQLESQIAAERQRLAEQLRSDPMCAPPVLLRTWAPFGRPNFEIKGMPTTTLSSHPPPLAVRAGRGSLADQQFSGMRELMDSYVRVEANAAQFPPSRLRLGRALDPWWLCPHDNGKRLLKLAPKPRRVGSQGRALRSCHGYC